MLIPGPGAETVQGNVGLVLFGIDLLAQGWLLRSP